MLTAGTGLTILLRPLGLALRPAKPRGGEVVHRIVAGENFDGNDVWPVGWKLDGSPRQTAPEFFENLNSEIDGYTLDEALGAIVSRLKSPVLIDHAAVARRGVPFNKVHVKLSRTNTYYKRILDRILIQAHLHGELRVDEAGTVFYWISR
jgi:hypothetical protein